MPHLNYCGLEHPDCHNNGKCGGHDIEGPVEEQADSDKFLEKELTILAAQIQDFDGVPSERIKQSMARITADREQYISKQKENWEKKARLDGYTKGWREAYKDMHDSIGWGSRSLVDKPCEDVAHLSSTQQINPKESE